MDISRSVADSDGKSRIRNNASQVSFLSSQVKIPSSLPVDFSSQRFETSEDVENYPLTSEHLCIVSESYEKTISKFHVFPAYIVS